MAAKRKTKEVAEFGDFQTPLVLAQRVCNALTRRRLKPQTIIEPTCGTGTFVKAVAERFPDASRILGIDINPAYVESAKAFVLNGMPCDKVEIRQGDFFATDYRELLSRCTEPILVIGNPPWVTNAALCSLGSSNLPEKSNFQGRGGFDAISGKANFDISEWMLIRLLEALNGRRATLAMLCKMAVARKALFHVWKEGIALKRSSIHSIDANQFFGASVEACLLVCDLAPGKPNYDCEVFQELGDAKKSRIIGYRDGLVLANVQAYERLNHLRGESAYRWRSGVKHDCSKVMELWAEGEVFRNGFGEIVELESDYLYPMLKTSEVANGSTQTPGRWMLVTQKSTGEDTSAIETKSPKTWKYLVDHAHALDSRGSSIYRKRPRFSVFGIGDYAFAQWKVAISGFYKKLGFTVIGPHKGKPVMLDDASYFIACQDEEEARFVQSILMSDAAQEFFSAFIFWDAKRPITVDVLQQLDIAALANELGVARRLKLGRSQPRGRQRELFDTEGLQALKQSRE